MSVPSFGVPQFFRERQIPLQLVNQVSDSALGSPAQFNSLPYGGFPTARRFCHVAISTQDGGNISNLTHDSLSWGGVSFQRRLHQHRLAANNSITVSLWDSFVPTGTSGNLVLNHNKSGIDSMGVATLVTSIIDNQAPVDADGSTDFQSTTDTVNDIATSAGGYMIGVGNIAYFDARFTSLAGNGGVGPMQELFDVSVENDHRMGLWLATGTPLATGEDFTLTHNEGFSFSAFGLASYK